MKRKIYEDRVTPYSPEEVCVLFIVTDENMPRCSDNFRLNQVIDSEAVTASKPTVSAANGQTTDAYISSALAAKILFTLNE